MGVRGAGPLRELSGFDPVRHQHWPAVSEVFCFSKPSPATRFPPGSTSLPAAPQTQSPSLLPSPHTAIPPLTCPRYGGGGGSTDFVFGLDSPLGGLELTLSARGWISRLHSLVPLSELVVPVEVSAVARQERASRCCQTVCLVVDWLIDWLAG